MQETQERQFRSLGREDALEEEMASHSSILAWRIPWTEEPGGLQSRGSQRVRYDWATEHSTKLDWTGLEDRMIHRAAWTLQTPATHVAIPS